MIGVFKNTDVCDVSEQKKGGGGKEKEGGGRHERLMSENAARICSS